MPIKTLNDMSVSEESRWYALMDAVGMIADECEKRGKDFNKLKLPPLDIEKYINATCDTYVKRIKEGRSIVGDVLLNPSPTQSLLDKPLSDENDSEEIDSAEDIEETAFNTQDF